MMRLRSWKLTFAAPALLSVALIGCEDSQTPQTQGPVEGKRLDGMPEASPQIAQGDAPAVTPENADKKKEKAAEDGKEQSPDSTKAPVATAEVDKAKREEWRDKKTGTPDEDDLVAKANIALRPSLAEQVGPTPPADKNKTAGSQGTEKQPVSPTDLAKPLKDPTAEIPFADPNNPDFIPADRTRYKTFSIDKLEKVDGHLVVPFMELSGFPYTGMVGAPEPAKDGDGKEPAKPQYEIPEAIKALDGKLVRVSGYMMPIDFEDGGTNEFVLTRQIPSCFYCVPPQLNDWVEVKMKDGKRVPYAPDGLVELYGTIEVGEMKEDGFVVNMYRMTGTKMVESKVE